jgi:hypothetical protein
VTDNSTFQDENNPFTTSHFAIITAHRKTDGHIKTYDRWEQVGKPTPVSSWYRGRPYEQTANVTFPSWTGGVNFSPEVTMGDVQMSFPEINYQYVGSSVQQGYVVPSDLPADRFTVLDRHEIYRIAGGVCQLWGPSGLINGNYPYEVKILRDAGAPWEFRWRVPYVEAIPL